MEYTRLVLSRMNPASDARQYSSRLIVPERLCSSNWRGPCFPSRPARTLGLRGRVDDPIRARKCFNVACHAQVAVHQLHAELLQRQPIGLAALARQVVETHDLDTLVGLEKVARQVAARKTARTRNQNPHTNESLPAAFASFRR